MKDRSLSLATLVIAALLGLASNLLAKAPAPPGSAPQGSSFTLEGKITRLEEGKITVNTEENIIFHVVYTDKTVFKDANGQAASAKDLRRGQRIHVAGDLNETGEVAADRVEILPAESPQKQEPR